MLLSVASKKIALSNLVKESKAAQRAMPILEIESLWPVTAACVCKLHIDADLVSS